MHHFLHAPDYSLYYKYNLPITTLKKFSETSSYNTHKSHVEIISVLLTANNNTGNDTRKTGKGKLRGRSHAVVLQAGTLTCVSCIGELQPLYIGCQLKQLNCYGAQRPFSLHLFCLRPGECCLCTKVLLSQLNLHIVDYRQFSDSAHN